jgi:cytochrome b561
MQWRNTPTSYGIVSIFVHWLVALAATGLFVLGMWMVDLDYYDPWYRRAPDIHKSIGILLLLVMTVRLGWRWVNPSPHAAAGVSRSESRVAAVVHGLLYTLLFAVMLSGYLISTADGRPIQVFDWFEVPAIVSGIDGQEDFAGAVHWYLASILIALAALHALAALKHHFLNGDNTLQRMLRVQPDNSERHPQEQ